MATYRLKKPAYIGGVLYEASNYAPQVYTFPDDVEPSRTWEPMDKAGVKALAKLGVEAKIAAPLVPVEMPDEPDTFSEIQKRGRTARAADTDVI